MNPLTVVRHVVGIVSSAGVGSIVGNAIKATTPDELSKIQKITIATGSIALSGAAGMHAANYVERQFDEGIKTFRMMAETSKALREKYN